MSNLEIPQDVINEVVVALHRGIGLALDKAPEMIDVFSRASIRLDEAINDALATEE